MQLAIWSCVVTLVVGFAAVAPTVSAQTGRPQETDVLTALLMEVRGLRSVMEQMASAGPRVQLALGRLQLQEQRVNTMIRRAEGMRESVGRAERETKEL